MLDDVVREDVEQDVEGPARVEVEVTCTAAPTLERPASYYVRDRAERTDQGLDFVVDALRSPGPFGFRLLRSAVEDRVRGAEARHQLNNEFRVSLGFFAQQIEFLLPVAAERGRG